MTRVLSRNYTINICNSLVNSTWAGLITLVPYSFPSDFPLNCPPQPQNDECGMYYRLVKNGDKSDPAHYKSHHEAKIREELESTKPCSRRALSMFKDYYEAVNLSKQFPNIGKYVAHLNLTGGHGVVCEENYCSFKSHHNWWVPIDVNAHNFCSHVEGPVS